MAQVDLRQWRTRLLGPFVGLALIGAGFAGGAATERAGLLPGAVVREPAAIEETFSPFWQAWRLVRERYVDQQAVDPHSMTYGAIDGMLDSLGDVGHSRFLTPEELKDEQAALAGRLEGIGAELAVRNGRPTVIAPIHGSPAERAGLRPGDMIVRVNGQEVSDLEVSKIVELVRGPAGTTVTLTVIHAGQTGLTDLTITRAQITVPSVTWAMLPGTSTAHVLISQFAEGAGDELVRALNAARSAGATGLVVDLRNDPGGIRDEAIAVTSQFLVDGDVLLEQDAQGHRTNYPVRPNGVATDLPLAVLINRGSASSAEITAGALQDHRRGPLIGETTFGTGTVLGIYPLSDGSALFLGIAEWLTPNGRQIWHHGIAPDVPVSLPNNAFPLTPDEESSLSAEQFQTTGDVQLLRALQELTRSGP